MIRRDLTSQAEEERESSLTDTTGPLEVSSSRQETPTAAAELKIARMPWVPRSDLPGIIGAEADRAHQAEPPPTALARLTIKVGA